MSKKFLGISREDEEAAFDRIVKLVDSNIRSAEHSLEDMKQDLSDIRGTYDLDEKEGLALWFNATARLKQAENDLRLKQRAKGKPYFGRIDIIEDGSDNEETFYVGRTAISKNISEVVVMDWRSPAASSYYEQHLGKCDYFVPGVGRRSLDLKRKRTYEFEDGKLKDYYDTEVVANDELLTKYLSKNKKSVLGEIIATIQQEQNEVIRRNPHHNVLIQGSAGSGKTTVAMHRISYILYNYDTEFAPKDFYIIGSNKVLLNYITGVLPDLDVVGISQMTMEDLFIRLLYEEWVDNPQKVKSLDKGDLAIGVKSGSKWYSDLCDFAAGKLRERLVTDDIVFEVTDSVVMSREEIIKTLDSLNNPTFVEACDRLTDILMSRVEPAIVSKSYILEKQEQNKLLKRYKRYFTRLRTKKKLFDVYDEFVNAQHERGFKCAYEKGNYDLYDLASMAYLYKVLFETEVIREATHVVIDEAQDFGIAAYASLKYCLSKCTFTIMGDVAQNINFGCGLGDWEDLKKLMLPDPYDYFGLLRKSYRNTIEISKFATDILRHGTFPIYPVEPIIRHGEEVKTHSVKPKEDLIDSVSKEIESLLSEYETIAVICASSKEAAEIGTTLSKKTDNVKIFSDEETEFDKGVMVLSIEYAKGLEFDAVIIVNADDKNYPYEDGYAKLLYVAATRALHHLSVYYSGKLTDLIAAPILPERQNEVFKEDDFHKNPVVFEEDLRTDFEKAKDQAELGNDVLKQREKYGPKRISAVSIKKPIGSGTTSPKSASSPSASAPSANNYKGQRHMITRGPSIVGDTMFTLPSSPSKTVFNAPSSSVSPTGKSHNSPVMSGDEFGRKPDAGVLKPAGHERIDTAVRWVSEDKNKVSFISSYGVLSIIPMSDDSVRIVFLKGSVGIQDSAIKPSDCRWKYKDNRDTYDIICKNLIVRVTKKTGHITFMKSNSEVLLKENDKLSRQFSENEKCWWNYFDFGKKELLFAENEEGALTDITADAVYVSHTGAKKKREGVIASKKGYRIILSESKKVMTCTMPVYPTYLKYEGSVAIDYIFSV